MQDFKPCPFCGGKANFYSAYIDVKHEGLVEFVKVRCTRCKAQTNIFRTEDAASNAWNTRIEKGENENDHPGAF